MFPTPTNINARKTTPRLPESKITSISNCLRDKANYTNAGLFLFGKYLITPKTTEFPKDHPQNSDEQEISKNINNTCYLFKLPYS